MWLLARRESLSGVLVMAALAIGAERRLAWMAVPVRRGILTDRRGPYSEFAGTASMVGAKPRPEDLKYSWEYCRSLVDTMAQQEGGCNMVKS